MKNTAKLVTIIKTNEIEDAIKRYQDLDNEIKTLEAKKSFLKESLIKSYFAKNDSYFNDDGLCLATYKAQIRHTFSTTDFKNDHPDMYNTYTKPQEIHVFLVKK
jgi:hypothetical protein